MKTPTTKNTPSSKSLFFRSVLAAFAFLVYFAAAQNSFAVTFTVNNNGDATDITAGNGVCETATGNGICTLRAAVLEANALAGDDIINFDAGISLITLTSGSEIAITSNVIINGTGANNLTIDGGPGTNRIFRLHFATVTIQGATLSGGNGGGAAVFVTGGMTTLEAVVVQNNLGGVGTGAVVFESGLTHRISNSTISGNTDFVDCAAIAAFDTDVTVENTTISGNSTTSGFITGAICVEINSTATFRNTTISGNTANGADAGGGGGIYIAFNVTVNLANTIVAGNSAPSGPDLYRNDSTATFTTSGGNLIGDNSGNPSAPNTTTFPAGNPNANGDRVGMAGSVTNPPIDPILGPLQNNGGPTPTRELFAGSPAIDSGNNAIVTEAFDQRGAGFQRIRNGTVDIGAFEVQAGTTAAAVSVGGRVTTSNGRGIRNVRITLSDSGGNVRTAITSSFGYYSFEDIPAGETYIITANAKRFTFSQPSRVLSVVDNAVDVDFIGW